LILAGLLLALNPAASVNARQATPVASPTPIDLGECTTEPRSIDEMRALLKAGLPPVLALFAGTPTASGDATPVLTRVPGAPADEETVAAVTETIFQFMACNNAGNLPAAVSLLTDQAAGSYLAFAFMPFREIYAGMTGTPTVDVDPGLIDMYLGTMQLRTALPPGFQIHLYDIESVTQLENGRVRAIVLQATGSGELEESYFLLRDVDGQYRIMFGPEEEGEASSTPAP
jgi:hypothetical protein